MPGTPLCLACLDRKALSRDPLEAPKPHGKPHYFLLLGTAVLALLLRVLPEGKTPTDKVGNAFAMAFVGAFLAQVAWATVVYPLRLQRGYVGARRKRWLLERLGFPPGVRSEEVSIVLISDGVEAPQTGVLIEGEPGIAFFGALGHRGFVRRTREGVPLLSVEDFPGHELVQGVRIVTRERGFWIGFLDRPSKRANIEAARALAARLAAPLPEAT